MLPSMEATAKMRQIHSTTARDLQLIAASRGEAETAESADKIGALRDASRALQSVGAAHAVIGGVAVGIRSGVPRATLDTNFAVVSTIERELVVRAFEHA